MTSLILRVSSRYLLVGLVVVSLWVLWRGHNAPGGGFSGALLAACGFALRSFACGVDEARRQLRFTPAALIASGLLTALAAALPGLIWQRELLASYWLPDLPLIGEVGTPHLFEVGVYLIVLGTATAAIFSLSDVET